MNVCRKNATLLYGVRKLFRIRIKNEIELRKEVKLSDRKIRWIVRHCHIKKDVSTKEAARIYGVSVRRIQQIVKEYRDTGEMPVLKKERRPRTHLTDGQKEIIEKVWKETKVGARLLYYELRKRE